MLVRVKNPSLVVVDQNILQQTNVFVQRKKSSFSFQVIL